MSHSITPTKAPSRSPISSRRRYLFIGIYLLYGIGLLLLTAWFFRTQRLGGFSRATSDNEVWTLFYPELRQSGVLDAETSADDGRIDVLLLGASVLEDASELLERRLRDEFGDKLRVFQLARAAHTSRDSFLKYSQIKDKHFDLIVIYDCINDVRMNCCPEAEFRDDYTHCGWYRSIQRRSEAGKVTLAKLVGDEFAFGIPLGEPDPELLKYGDKIKTAEPFRRNIEQIVSNARERGEPVLLMTFAYFIPETYTREKFDARELGYGAGHHQLPAEIWGLPQNVAHTIDKHNEAIESLSREYDNVIAVDQRKLLPADGAHFSDPCHLTEPGNRQFVDNMLPAIVRSLKQTKPAR